MVRYRSGTVPYDTVRYGTVNNSTFSGMEDKSPREGGTTNRGRLVSRQKTASFPILGSPAKRRYISRS